MSDHPATPSPSPARALAAAGLGLLLATLAQWLLATNPGWFSHDELQWGARASGEGPLPGIDWAAFAAVQWRPLSFQLWLWLGRALFAAPLAWHALWVIAGSSNAALLAALLVRLGSTRAVAVAAALVFALGPYAVYVHGWAATVADLLVLGFALGLAHVLVTARRWPALAIALASLGITALALAAKESALAYPAVLALCRALWPGRRGLAPATVGAILAGIVYLSLRLPALLAAGATEPAYALAPAAIPENWLAYHLFVPRLSTFEVTGLWRAPTGALVLAAVFWGALWTAVARAAGTRLAIALILGGTLWLAPMLAIANTANQYGYLFSAWCVALVALAWPRLGRSARVFVLVFAALVLWHGANVQRGMRTAGERAAVFLPALAATLAAEPRRDGPLRLYAPADEAWLYRRLTHQVPHWRGTVIADRVQLVDSPERADYQIGADGRLLPPASPRTGTD